MLVSLVSFKLAFNEARNETRKKVNWEKMNLSPSLRSYASINEGNHQFIYQATLQVMLVDLRPADDVGIRKARRFFHEGKVFAIGPWGAGDDDVVAPGEGMANAVKGL